MNLVLLQWYSLNKRNLPWRESKDPYKIWLSEVILQQTRVEQGLPYYNAFINAYPTVDKLASASEDEVLKLWQGLGYYSRARNLHHAAKQVCAEFNSVFPTKYDDLIKLKGVGEYTASAISSFSSNEKKPVLDGNVYRFISRYYGIEDYIELPSTKKKIMEILHDLIEEVPADEFNQAIMEFGAIQCKPAKVQCNECVFRTSCYAYKNNLVNTLPLKKKKTERKKRYFNYFIVQSEAGYPIQKRTEKDIWKHLYEFPLIETDKALDLQALFEDSECKKIFPKGAEKIELKYEQKHLLSHQEIYAKFWHVKESSFLKYNAGKYVFIKDEEIMNFAFPRLIEQYLQK